MSVEERGITCDECGVPLDPGTPKGSPCPECGCKVQRLHVVVSETITIHSAEGFRIRMKGTAGWVKEHLQGADLHRKSGKWMHKERTIDKEGDRYREVVIDPKTGEVVHHCDEPLSEHRSRRWKRTDQQGRGMMLFDEARRIADKKVGSRVH
jgi:hypothetical protein